jgi:hypothetical protein
MMKKKTKKFNENIEVNKNFKNEQINDLKNNKSSLNTSVLIYLSIEIIIL